MAVKIERPTPPTVSELVVEGAKKGVFSFVKFYFIVLPAVLLLTLAVHSISPFLAPFALIGGFGYVFRRPIRFTYRKIQSARARRRPPPSLEAEEYETDPAPEDAPPRGALIGEDLETGEELTISPELRGRHLYFIGKTRTGKTTFIKNLITQDMDEGHGLAFLDPHGDAAGELLGTIPRERAGDVIYFDPTSPDAPAFNPLRLPYPPHKLTEDMVSLFKMFFGDSWGYRLEHILRYSFLTLISQKEPRTLADLRHLLTSKDFRADIIRTTEEDSLREFWETEFPSMEKGAINPIINKLSALLAPTSPSERIFSTKENDLDFSAILNTSKILIVNLSKGTLGDEPSRLLGGFITTGIQQAALARATMPEAKRTPFYFYVDEFQNYAVASFETILAEASKYRLFLTLANQNLAQLPTSLERAIFGNVGTFVSFQVSAEDAATLKREMHRSRLTVRPKEASTLYSLSDFVAGQKELYREALGDKHLGMSREERKRLARLRVMDGKKGIVDLLHGGSDEAFYFAQRRGDIERTLDVLEHGELTPSLLRELFSDYEFREYTFPDVDDFINLPPHHAFARIGRAENVFAFRTFPAPSPDPQTREEILHAQHRRAADREQENAKPTAASKTSRLKQDTPKSEEDFHF